MINFITSSTSLFLSHYVINLIIWEWFLNWLLKNWNVVDLQCCVGFWCIAKWYTYFFIFFSIMVYDWILNVVPCANNRTLLFIYFVCSTLYLLIQTPNLSLPHPVSPLGTIILFSVWTDLFNFTTSHFIPEKFLGSSWNCCKTVLRMFFTLQQLDIPD